MADRIPVESVVFRTDLYPRIDQSPETVSRYAEDLEPLPPIEINQNNILIDGWHRWTAHKQAGVADLLATVTETTSEAEVFRLAVERNAKHGLQLSAADKRKYVKDVWLAADRPDGVLEAEIARTVAMSISAVQKVLARSKKDAKAVQHQRMARLWLAGCTQQEIAEQVGVPQQTFIDFLQVAKIDKSLDLDGITKSLGWKVDADHAFALAGQRPTMDPFDVPLFDVWKAKTSVNAVKHPGQSDQLFTDRLVYLYTKPGDMVIDPFAGGGPTVDVCKARLRRYFCSDLTVVPSRVSDIRQHDITEGALKPPQWKDVALVYLDPPYGGQVEGAYSDKATDLANLPVDAFHEQLLAVINGYVGKLSSGAHVALIIQATQWRAPEKERQDHVVALASKVRNADLRERIQVPYESQQATAQMVDWAKVNRRVLTLSREIVVWRVK